LPSDNDLWFRDGLPAAVEQLSSRLKLYMQVSPPLSLFIFFRKVQREAPVRKGRVFAQIFRVLYICRKKTAYNKAYEEAYTLIIPCIFVLSLK
jgi:hypothetical protein